MRMILILLVCILTACSTHVPKDLVVLRATWSVPAKQAGVYEELRSEVARLDDAVLSGDVEEVVKALRDFYPIYIEVRSSIDNPTAEQLEFDRRVQRLWEEINANRAERVLDAAVLALRLIVLRV